MDRDSPFALKFGTNYIPTDQERTQIKGLIRTRRTKLEPIQAELEKLHSLEAELSSDIQNHAALLSPVRRLPDDILLEIFKQCLLSTYYPKLHPRWAPTNLTQVCHVWRQLALITPSFWQSIFISGADNHSDSQGFANTIQTWFERSAGKPLNISLHDSEPRQRLAKPVIDVVLSVIGRWKEIHLGATLSTVQDLIHRLNGTTAPALRTLSVWFNDQNAQTRSRWTIDKGNFNAPLLTRFLLTGVGGHYWAFPIDWSQTTHLTFQSLNAPIFVAGIRLMLGLCPNLRSCRIDMPTKGRLGDFPYNTQPIVLRSLEKLSIREWNDDFSLFFRLLNAPVLRHIEYRKCGLGPAMSCTILPLLDQAVVQTIITDGHLLNTDQLLEILRHTPRLKSLSLKMSSFNAEEVPCNISLDTLLQKVCAVDENDSPFIPDLEEFEYRLSPHVSIPLLLAFIRTRRMHYAFRKIRRITIPLPEHQRISLLFELENFLPSSALEGLEIDIENTQPKYYSSQFDVHEWFMQNAMANHPF